MTAFTDKALDYYNALKPIDKLRIKPIIDLYESCASNSSIDYYHPNILYFYVNDKLAFGLAPRKSYISFYVGSYETDRIFKAALPRLGTSTHGVGCIRFKKLDDIDMLELKKVFCLIAHSEHSGGGALQE